MRSALAANEALEKAGSVERIDHRSYADRGINREPEPKLGPCVFKMEETEKRLAANENRPPRPREELTERGELWVEVKFRNQLRARLEKDLVSLRNRISVLSNSFFRDALEKYERLTERFDAVYHSLQEPIQASFSRKEDTEKAGEYLARNLLAEQKKHSDKDRLLGRDKRDKPTAEERNRERLLGRKRGRPVHKNRDRGDRDR